MRILVSNDDGINARGIHELVAALSNVAEVYVSAPHIQRSAAGHGMTLTGSLFVRETAFAGAVKAYEVSGTPADCVKVGIYLLKEQGIEIDMVFSGINHGGNLGTDTLYSGTVSAALEGNLKGYPAVAVSVDLAGSKDEPQHFEYAAQLAVKFAKWGFGENKDAKEEKGGFSKFGRNITLSINVPNLPAADIKGVKTGILAKRAYLDNYTNAAEAGSYAEEGKTEYTYGGTLVNMKYVPDNCDVGFIAKGYATVTPLKTDLTDYELIDDISAITDIITE